MDREPFRNAHGFEHTFLGIDAVFKLDVIVVRGVQSAADPSNDSKGASSEPAKGMPYAMPRLRFERLYHLGTAVQDITACSSWYKVKVQVTWHCLIARPYVSNAHSLDEPLQFILHRSNPF